MSDADLLAEVRAATVEREQANARWVAAIRAAQERCTRATTRDEIAAAAGFDTRAGVYKMLRRAAS